MKIIMCTLYIYEGNTRKHAEKRISVRLNKYFGRIICVAETKFVLGVCKYTKCYFKFYDK